MIKHICKMIWNKRRSNALILIEIFLAFLVLFAVLSYVISNMRMLSAPLGFETQDKWIVNLDDLSSKDSLDVLEMILINAGSFGGNAPRYYYPGLPRNYFIGGSIKYSFN